MLTPDRISSTAAEVKLLEIPVARRIFVSMAVIASFFRESLSAQLELTLTKAHSEQLARSIAEEQVGVIVCHPLFS